MIKTTEKKGDSAQNRRSALTYTLYIITFRRIFELIPIDWSRMSPKRPERIDLTISNMRLLDKPMTVGSETYQSDAHKIYFAFSFAHSIPARNANRVGFFYPELRKSVGAPIHQPFDFEHQMECSPYYDGQNRVVGFIVDTFIDQSLPADTLFPESPVALDGIGVLHTRFSETQQILKDIEDGVEWATSMEIDPDEHDWSQDVMVAGETIFDQENDQWDEVFGLWAQNKTHEGDSITYAFGGTGIDGDYVIPFFGSGMTKNPADTAAEIHDMPLAAMKDAGGKQFMAFAVKTEGVTMPITITVDENLQNATLEIDGKDYPNIDNLYMDVGGDWTHLSWSEVETDEQGVSKRTNFFYDPDNKTATEGSIMEINAQVIAAVMEQLKKDGWKTKEEIDSLIAAENDKLKGYLSPEDHAAKVKKAEDAVREEIKNLDALYVSREKELTDAKLELTDSRVEKIREFPADEDGNKKCTEWIASLKTGQTTMATVAKENKLDPEKYKVLFASYDGPEDERFKAVIDANKEQPSTIASAPADLEPDTDTDDEIDHFGSGK